MTHLSYGRNEQTENLKNKQIVSVFISEWTSDQLLIGTRSTHKAIKCRLQPFPRREISHVVLYIFKPTETTVPSPKIAALKGPFTYYITQN